jgi:serine/tyrosine/threonine adenylyltransferase
MAQFDALVAVLAAPFDERRGLEGYSLPAPQGFGPYRTYCGT